MAGKGIIMVNGVPEVHSAEDLAEMRAVNPALEILCGGFDIEGNPCMCPVHLCRRGKTIYLSSRHHIPGCSCNRPRTAKDAPKENILGINTSADELIDRYSRRVYHDTKSTKQQVESKAQKKVVDRVESDTAQDSTTDLLDITSSIKNPRNTKELVGILLAQDPTDYFGDYPPRQIRNILIRSDTLADIHLPEEMQHPVIVAASLRIDKVRLSLRKHKITMTLSAAPNCRFELDFRGVPNLFSTYRDLIKEFVLGGLRIIANLDTVLCVSGRFTSKVLGEITFYRLAVSNPTVLCWLTK